MRAPAPAPTATTSVPTPASTVSPPTLGPVKKGVVLFNGFIDSARGRSQARRPGG
jgi:hypothetical protein